MCHTYGQVCMQFVPLDSCWWHRLCMQYVTATTTGSVLQNEPPNPAQKQSARARFRFLRDQLDTNETFSIPGLQELANVDAIAARGAPYIPVWFVAPKAWAQLRLNPPIFNGNGLVNLAQLGERR